jgi:hypothetical protein
MTTVAATATDAPTIASTTAAVAAPPVDLATQFAFPAAVTYGQGGHGEPDP